MSPRLEQEAAMDDMADYAATLRPTRPGNLIDEFCEMPMDRLVEEANGLQSRMLSSSHTTRDFALVAAMTMRLQHASVSHARASNREALEGMLYLGDIPEERRTPAAALRFDGIERRRA